jgi:hypothetical protein
MSQSHEKTLKTHKTQTGDFTNVSLVGIIQGIIATSSSQSHLDQLSVRDLCEKEILNAN